jgi:N-acetylglucosamine malate deacetylase 1
MSTRPVKLDVLAIGAHPDDVELACGGTIIKLVRQGKHVGLLDLTEGELGTRGSREIRAREARQAARVMGVTLRENLGLPDGNIEVNERNRAKLIRVIRRYRPEILLIHHWLERHPDHEHAHRLAREAWFYAGLQRLETSDRGRKQAPHRPGRFFSFMPSFEFAPTFVVDVSDEFPQRMEAVRAFRSQFYDPKSKERETVLSSPGFFKRLEVRLAYFGDRVGVKYAEPFFGVDMVKVDDLFSLVPAGPR